MKFNGDKYVRFKNVDTDKSLNFDQRSNNRIFQLKKPDFSSMMRGIKSRLDIGSERLKSFKRPSFINLHPQNDKPSNKPSSENKILDPQKPFLGVWNRLFIFSCLLAVFLDPLFFYIPVVDAKNLCLSLDENLEIIACVLRTFNDLFYILHIIFQFRTGFIARSSRVFGRGELIEDPKSIAVKYLKSYFIIDVLAVLPIPQVLIIVVIPAVGAPVSLVTKDLLTIVIFCQYVPRLLRIYPLYKEVTRTSGKFTETPWAGAAFNLLLYMLASHIIGAIWYLISVERKDTCWRIACRNNHCNLDDLYCGGVRIGDTSFLKSSCPLLEPKEIKNDDDFDFGIFIDVLQSRVPEHKHFLRKFFFCFWWGLRNLSALGQNLRTSSFVGEILFSIFICIIGLVLFSLLIGNMQKYLQSMTVRVEQMRLKRQDAEQWMSHRMLPENLRGRIRRYEQYRWQETRGVEEESLIRNLPKDLRRDIKRHLCWTLVTRVPMFEKMDEQLLDAMCSFLKPVLYTESSFIVREGEPVDEMLFIMRGDILTMTTNGGRTGFFNSVYLKAGDFCGEELLTWALDPNSSPSLPISTRTVQAKKDVEAFSLMANDLKFVASQFRHLHSKQLQQTFKFHSQQWRTWGATYIQAAWRRYCRRKILRSLQEAEDIQLQDALLMARQEGEAGGGTSPTLGSTIYASTFAANLLGATRQNHPTLIQTASTNKLSPKLPPLLLQKPEEPDFSVATHSK